jgi:outer membrane protein assembly factor BamB
MYDKGLLYVMSGYRGNALFAIDLARAKGNITDTDVIVWKYLQDTPYTPSPVLMDGRLYFLKANNGTLTCLDARDGRVIYSNQKIDGIVNIYSSPTGAGQHLFIASEGMVNVVDAGDTFRVAAQNLLDDNFHASPVAIGKDLYIRGFRSLYCFSAN